jgi:hypothetical protein
MTEAEDLRIYRAQIGRDAALVGPPLGERVPRGILTE